MFRGIIIYCVIKVHNIVCLNSKPLSVGRKAIGIPLRRNGIPESPPPPPPSFDHRAFPRVRPLCYIRIRYSILVHGSFSKVLCAAAARSQYCYDIVVVRRYYTKHPTRFIFLVFATFDRGVQRCRTNSSRFGVTECSPEPPSDDKM